MSNAEIIAKLEVIEKRATAAALSTKETLTFEEAAIYSGLSRQYLYKLTSTKQIPFYKPSGKMIYFDRPELDGWLKRNRVSTAEEADTAAAAYVARNPKGNQGSRGGARI